MSKLYTGVGSRNTPLPVLFTLSAIARKLGENGYVLRSGGAKGADSAFEWGASKYEKVIFYSEDATEAAMGVARKFHPSWNSLSEYAKGLHGSV